MVKNPTRSSFFEITPGAEISLEDFPSLLAMQGHQGACGLLFSFLWFLLATAFAPSDIWTAGGTPLKFLAGAILLFYFGLSWASFFSVSYFSNRVAEVKVPHADAAARSKQDRNVRVWMSLLCGAYALVCSVLIWLTGGAISPFTPFYVMIFTLTITKIRVSKNIGGRVLGFFLFAILAACILTELLPPLIDSNVRYSRFQIMMHIVFISAALIVPTVSQYIVERRKARAKGEVEPIGSGA